MKGDQIIFDVLRFAEAVPFAFVEFEDMRDMDTAQQTFGLLLRHHHILVSLEDRQGTLMFSA